MSRHHQMTLHDQKTFVVEPSTLGNFFRGLVGRPKTRHHQTYFGDALIEFDPDFNGKIPMFHLEKVGGDSIRGVLSFDGPAQYGQVRVLRSGVRALAGPWDHLPIRKQLKADL